MPGTLQNQNSISNEVAFRRESGKWLPCLIFKAGDYPDKMVSFDNERIKIMARSSKGIPITIGHPSAESPLDGSFGFVESLTVRPMPDGDEIWGIPTPVRQLDELLPDEVGVSVRVSASPMLLVDASIVSYPRVDSASFKRAIAYAFSAGQEAPRKEVPMEGTSTTNPFERFFEMVFGSRQQGGAPPQAPQMPAPAHNPVTTPQPDPQFAAMQAELNQFRTSAMEARRSEIAQFSQSLIEKGRITPAVKSDVESLLLAAAEADQANVQFSSKPEGGLFAQLKKVLGSLPEDPKGLLKTGFSIIPGQTPAAQDEVAAAFAAARGETK